MSFFDPPPPPPEPFEQPPQPEWVGPPDNVLAEAVPLSVLLARTETVALIVTGGLVYGGPIRDAASRAQVLWPDHGGDGGWETSQFVLGSE